MKRTLIALAIFAVGPKLLFAGVATIPESKNAVATPEQHELCNWTGFYIGANVGYAFEANSDVTLDLGGAWGSAGANGADKIAITPFGSHDLKMDGVVAGGFFGYNYQWNNFVLGVEAGANYVDLSDSFNSGLIFVPASGDSVGVRHSVETNFVGTFGPRIGYAFNRLLLYVTGGVAFGDVKFSQEVVEPEFLFVERGSTDDIEVGWMAGGGLQYCLTEHWSVRAEYRYTDLGCADFSSVGNQTQFTGHHEACLTFHSVTAGLAYKF